MFDKVVEWWGRAMIISMILLSIFAVTVFIASIVSAVTGYARGETISTGASPESMSSLQDDVVTLRSELNIVKEGLADAFAAGLNLDAITYGELVGRIEGLETMLALKPEDVVSVSVLAEKVSGVERAVDRLEARLDSEVGSLYTLVIGTVGAILVTFLATVALSARFGKPSA